MPTQRLGVRPYLKRFLFTDDRVNERVDNLSGGERARLMLAKVLKRGGNVIVLDEPTNDLDLPSLRMLEEAKANRCEVLLPIDLVVSATFAADAPSRTVGIDSVPADMMALDVGPDTVAAIEARLRQASTLVWNGPLGAFEIPPFDAATVAVAQSVAALTQSAGLKSIGGGGDTVSALTGPSTSLQISRMISMKSRPDFFTRLGLVVTPSTRPSAFNSRISSISAVSTKNFMRVASRSQGISPCGPAGY